MAQGLSSQGAAVLAIPPLVKVADTYAEVHASTVIVIVPAMASARAAASGEEVQSILVHAINVLHKGLVGRWSVPAARDTRAERPETVSVAKREGPAVLDDHRGQRAMGVLQVDAR